MMFALHLLTQSPYCALLKWCLCVLLWYPNKRCLREVILFSEGGWCIATITHVMEISEAMFYRHVQKLLLTKYRCRSIAWFQKHSNGGFLQFVTTTLSFTFILRAIVPNVFNKLLFGVSQKFTRHEPSTPWQIFVSFQKLLLNIPTLRILYPASTHTKDVFFKFHLDWDKIKCGSCTYSDLGTWKLRSNPFFLFPVPTSEREQLVTWNGLY